MALDSAREEEAAFGFLTLHTVILAVMQFLVLSTVLDAPFITFTWAVGAVVTSFRLSLPTSGSWLRLGDWLKHGYGWADSAHFHWLLTSWQRVWGTCMTWWTAAAPFYQFFMAWQRTWAACLTWWSAVPSIWSLSLDVEFTKVSITGACVSHFCIMPKIRIITLILKLIPFAFPAAACSVPCAQAVQRCSSDCSLLYIMI